MDAGLRDQGEGQFERARTHFTAALEIARGTPSKPVWLAYSTWHLGDLYYEYAELGTPREVEALLDESYAAFATVYGPQHPVVIPVLLRLSQLHAARGDTDAAAELLELADEVTARRFPESHFLRVRHGQERPASGMHPHEVLRLLDEIDSLDG